MRVYEERVSIRGRCAATVGKSIRGKYIGYFTNWCPIFLIFVLRSRIKMKQTGILKD